jgi:tyrosyl-DNA phosphodiesterase-1
MRWPRHTAKLQIQQIELLLRWRSHTAPSGASAPLGPPAEGPAGLQLIWPTVEEVRGSVEGWAAGVSIPGSSKNITKDFLQRYYHKWGGEMAGRQHAM